MDWKTEVYKRMLALRRAYGEVHRMTGMNLEYVRALNLLAFLRRRNLKWAFYGTYRWAQAVCDATRP